MTNDEWDDPPMNDSAESDPDGSGAAAAVVGVLLVAVAVLFYLDGHPVLAFGSLALLAMLTAVITFIAAAVAGGE